MQITLHQFVLDFALPNPSPFCMKVETFLRMAGVDYAIEPWNPMNAPMGKAPTVVVDGEVLADSSLILEGLVERTGFDPDASVPERDLAMARAMTRVLEEHTYWALLWIRWVEDAGWSLYGPVIASSLPVPSLFRPLMAGYLRRGVIRSCWAHGLSRHAPDEIHRRAIQDLQGIAGFLADRDFLGGSSPCTYDASASAFLEQLAYPEPASPVQAHLVNDPVLTGYLHRMREVAWSDRTMPPIG